MTHICRGGLLLCALACGGGEAGDKADSGAPPPPTSGSGATGGATTSGVTYTGATGTPAGTTPAGTSGGTPTGTTGAGTPSHTGDTGAAVTRLRLEAGPPCADPSLRDAAPYDRQTIAFGPHPDPYHFEHGGLAVADLDGDGWNDLFLAHAPPEVWLADPGGRSYRLAAAALEGIDLSHPVGATAADVDGDGDQDLLVTRLGPPSSLLLNDGTGHFTDGTLAAGLGLTVGGSVSAAFTDLDRDGDLDLMIGNYGINPADGDDPDLPPGDPSELYLNDGDGTFTDVSDRLPAVVQDAYVFQVGFVDVDADGWTDLLSVHDFGQAYPSAFLRNVGGDLVHDPTLGFDTPYDGMGLGIGDLNADGVPDLVQTSLRDISLLTSVEADTETGWLYVESADALTFEISYGTDPVRKGHDVGWGAEFVDLDNDADLDAVLVFGNWNMFRLPIREDEADGVWLRKPDGLYEEVAEAWGMNDPWVTRGLATVDLDRDGWIDWVRRPLDADTAIDHARCGAGGWLTVSLSQPGMNRFGIGARVELVHGDTTQVRWVNAGSTSLFTGSPPEVHFGLGDTATAELVVHWPDGVVERFPGVPASHHVTVER